MAAGGIDLVALLRLTPDEATRHAAADEIRRLRTALKHEHARVAQLEGTLQAIAAHARSVRRERPGTAKGGRAHGHDHASLP
jgi:hypothetical protein